MGYFGAVNPVEIQVDACLSYVKMYILDSGDSRRPPAPSYNHNQPRLGG